MLVCYYFLVKFAENEVCVNFLSSTLEKIPFFVLVFLFIFQKTPEGLRDISSSIPMVLVFFPSFHYFCSNLSTFGYLWGGDSWYYFGRFGCYLLG